MAVEHIEPEDEAPRCLRIREGRKPEPTCAECARLDCPVYREWYGKMISEFPKLERELEEQLLDAAVIEEG